MEINKIYQGDCLEIIKEIDDNSVDAIITDPLQTYTNIHGGCNIKYMNKINDLQIGKVGEYLVCADLILKGYIAFLSEQGLHYDVVLFVEDKLYKVQVKTTRKPIPVPQRKKRTDKYTINIRRCGSGGRKFYEKDDVDIFAVVAIDTKTIGYIKAKDAKQTMFFLPENGFIAGNGKGGGKTRLSLKKISDYKIEDILK